MSLGGNWASLSGFLNSIVLVPPGPPARDTARYVKY